MKLDSEKLNRFTKKLQKSNLKVGDLMTESPITVRLDEDLGSANKVMERKMIRHLPVVDNAGKLRGILTHRDILRFTVPENLESDEMSRRLLRYNVPVGEAMHFEPETITSDASLEQAAHIISDKKYGCLPVIDKQEKLVGILTEGDFVALFARCFSN